MPTLMEIATNPVFRFLGQTLGRWSHTEPAYTPGIYQIDGNGYASFQPGINPSGQELQWQASYNASISTLSNANMVAVAEAMATMFPITNSLYNPMSDFDAHMFTEDLRWLNNPAGGDFYNDPANFTIFPENPDGEGSFRANRVRQKLMQSNLMTDDTPFQNKANAGITSPIVIDLDGDGVDTTSFLTEKSVLFDIDGDGVKDKTAWLSGKDAFLAIDRNANSQIDDASELFGGAGRGDGFAKLAEFDSNNDGKIDNNDSNFSDLLLWQDKNRDGVTDADELHNASDAGLQSIDLQYLTQDVFESGNLLGEVSNAVFGGKNTHAVDVYFRFNSSTTGLSASSSDSNASSLLSAMSTFSAPASSSVSAPIESQIMFGATPTPENPHLA